MEIRDPDNPDDNSPIVQMLTIGNELIFFKETSIHKALTADTIDPQKSKMNTRHSHELLYSVGASNSFVARMILQFHDMIRLALPGGSNADDLIQRVWDDNKLLLECEKSFYHIFRHTIDLMPKCDEIIEAHKDKPSIPAMPKVPDLKTHVSDFLINGKKFLVAAHRLLNVFYDLPLNGNNEAHFGKHASWIKRNLGDNHPIYETLTANNRWIRLISECSNAIRHDEPGLRLEVKNFSLEAGNKFSAPAWRFDLTKKGLENQKHYTDLIYDLDVRIYNMLTFYEEILILCLKDELEGNKLLDIFRINEDLINPKCPSLYEINLKSQS